MRLRQMDDMFSLLSMQPFVAAVLVDSLSGPKVNVDAIMSELHEARCRAQYAASDFTFVCVHSLCMFHGCIMHYGMARLRYQCVFFCVALRTSVCILMISVSS